jgi:hypothetical protein
MRQRVDRLIVLIQPLPRALRSVLVDYSCVDAMLIKRVLFCYGR